MSMKVTVEQVTPAKAQQWLNANRSNRNMREGGAEKYAADMAAGRWTQCVDPICFYEDDDMANGQHRCWAVILSDTTQTFLIARGISREDGFNIDRGMARTIVDNARISGIDKGLSGHIVSAARAIAMGQGGKSNGHKVLSDAARLEMVTAHREAAEFAVNSIPKAPSIRNAAVYGAVGRAFYHEEDHARLKRFCTVIGRGFMEGDSESAAVAIRNYLVSQGQACQVGAAWGDTFLKVQNAIWYFMRRKPLTYIKTVAEERYPLAKSKALPLARAAVSVRKVASKLAADAAKAAQP